VPAIAASGIPFGVVQRPKPRWQEVFASGSRETLDFTVDKKPVCTGVQVLHPAEKGIPDFMPPQALIFGSGTEDLGPIVNRASSFSCSLGAAMSKVLVPILSELPLEEDDQVRPLLFCCENDHAAVVKLAGVLQGRVTVVDCMVDRVCMGRTIRPDSVDIEAEPWRGSLVPLLPGLQQRVPFSTAVATLPRSTLEAEYLSQRKFSLVNGMHTVMAFLTLINQYEGPDREYVLEKYVNMKRSDQRMVEAWRAARISELMEEFGMSNLKEWHGVERDEEVWEVLLQYSDTVLVDRFSKVDDLVSRVLGGGVANRWMTRLKPTVEWLEDHKSKGEARALKKTRLPDWVTNQEIALDAQAEARSAFLAYALKRGETGPAASAGREAPKEDKAAEALAEIAAAATAREARDAARKAVSGQVLLESFGRINKPRADAESAEMTEAEYQAAVVAAGASDFVLETLTEMIESSRQFCKRELDKTHQAFIKEQRKAGGKKFSPTAKKALEEDLERLKAELIKALESNPALLTAFNAGTISINEGSVAKEEEEETSTV